METKRIVISKHALRRFVDRFHVVDLDQIKRVVKNAAREGSYSAAGNDVLIEHGCLLIAGMEEGDTLVITTVMNLSNGISRKFQRRLTNLTPSTWSVATTIVCPSFSGVASQGG